MREKKIQEKLIILNLSHGITGLLLKMMKLVGNHLQEDQQNSCLQNFRKVRPCLDPWDIVRLECPGEMLATQRAFLLPYQEGVGGSLGGSVVQALRLCGNAQGVCADWFAPFGSGR